MSQMGKKWNSNFAATPQLRRAARPGVPENLIAGAAHLRLNSPTRFCQGPWNADLRTPPGPEGSNGSLLRMRRGYPGSFDFGLRIVDCGLRVSAAIPNPQSAIRNPQ